jgi:hypothetical protein
MLLRKWDLEVEPEIVKTEGFHAKRSLAILEAYTTNLDWSGSMHVESNEKSA